MRQVYFSAPDKEATILVQMNYVVCVARETYADPGWRSVVEALQEIHQAIVLQYPHGHVWTLKEPLSTMAPRYAAFIAPPSEIGPGFVQEVHYLTTGWGGVPYGGCLWGIVTGYEANDALRMVTSKTPLVARRLLSGCWVRPHDFVEGVSFSENVPGEMWEKRPGEQSEQGACPPDATEAIVQELNTGTVDAVVTSGHATQYDWQIGYAFRSGQFLNHRGQLVGVDLQGISYPVDSPNPKVYLAAGNCLLGHIFDQKALALAWMRTAGVRQFVGYTVRTWYGFVGWRAWDYWVGSQGTMTLAEAFFAAVQACIFELHRRFPQTADFHPPNETGDHYQGLFAFAMQQGISDRDNVGLLWDREAVAFYGDPAWEARVMPAIPPAWEQEVSVDSEGGSIVQVTVTITATKNGSLPRPIIAFLPFAIQNVEIQQESAPSDVGVGSFFVLWHIDGDLADGETRTLKFVGTRTAEDSEILRRDGD